MTETSGASPQIEWIKMTQEEINRVRCKATRGPRSRIQCEVHEGHNDSHAGRGRKGQWFTW